MVTARQIYMVQLNLLQSLNMLITIVAHFDIVAHVASRNGQSALLWILWDYVKLMLMQIIIVLRSCSYLSIYVVNAPMYKMSERH